MIFALLCVIYLVKKSLSSISPSSNSNLIIFLSSSIISTSSFRKFLQFPNLYSNKPSP
nr:MAG TPA: hypothetical protein [Bacteriophage sp.]